MNCFTRKLAHNRGNARIWLERKCLLSNGITNGMRFKVADTPVRFNVSGDTIGVTLVFCDDGDRKVAGTAERPIIDINTGKLNSVMVKTHYRVKVCDQPLMLIITPIDNPNQ